MKKQRIIAFDLDGVLGNLVPAICDLCSKLTGVIIAEHEWTTYNYHLSLGVDHKEFIEGHVTHNVLENIIIYDDVVKSINLLRACGFTIAVITARGFHPNGEAITRETFNKEGIEVDHLLLVDLHETKVDAMRVLQELGEVFTYIDDYLPHLHSIEIAEMNIKLFLMDKPWNQDDESFTRLSSIRQYADAILKIYKQ